MRVYTHFSERKVLINRLEMLSTSANSMMLAAEA